MLFQIISTIAFYVLILLGIYLVWRNGRAAAERYQKMEQALIDSVSRSIENATRVAEAVKTAAEAAKMAADAARTLAEQLRVYLVREKESSP